MLETVVRSSIAGLAVDDVSGPSTFDRIDRVEQCLESARFRIGWIPRAVAEVAIREHPVGSGDEFLRGSGGYVEPTVGTEASGVCLLGHWAGGY